MNQFYMQERMYHNTSSRSQLKKGPIMENFGLMTDDLATTLFLGDLSVICNEVKLEELFYRFGVIESIQLKKSDRDPQRAHLGFGFIKFTTRESAERALQEMNGYFFLGRAMRVGWAMDFGKKTTQSLMDPIEDPKKRQTAQIHVMFVTRELNRRVSELDLGAVFSRYGNLVDIAIKKHAINTEYGVQSGYAFLHFALTREGLTSAITAVEQGHLLVKDNITYRCKVTHSLQTQLMSVRQKQEKTLGKRSLPPSLTHAFPSSLDDSTFQTYNSPPAREYHISSTTGEFHEKDFPSYHTSPTKTMSDIEQFYEVLPPRLYDFPSVEANETPFTFSNDHRIMNENTADLIHPSFTVNHGATTATAYTQDYFNDHHHYHQYLPTKPLTSSLSSSSFIRSAYEDSSMQKN